MQPVRTRGYLSFCLQVWKRRDLVRYHDIDVIVCDSPHLTGPVALLVAWKTGAKLVVNNMAQMIGNKHYVRERWLNRLKSWIGSFVNRRADAVRVSTRVEVEAMRAAGFEHAYYVPFYIDQAALAERLPREPDQDGDTSVRVLFVGRLAKQKNLETLLAAAAKLRGNEPRVTVTIVGDGPERERLETIAREHGVEKMVTFTGAVAYEEVMRYFAASDIFCLTSIYEGTCMVLHEAAVARLPIVASEVAGARDLIRDGENGFLAPIGDSDAVAEALARLAADRALRERFGTRIHERVTSEFTRERALERFRALIEHVQK